jgi:hypothetical protein
MSTSVETVALDAENLGAIRADGLPSPYNGVARQRIGAGRLARLAARARSGSLDRELIAGADIAGSEQLAARAARLTAPSTRATIADGLEGLIGAAQGPKRRWSAVGRRDHLLANSEEIGELVTLLRGEIPLRAHGIAILSELLSDGTGPAYHGGGEELACRLDEARSAMHS